jgi:hypothetical protein
VNSFEGSSTSLPEATLTLIFVVELLEVEGWGSTNFRQKKSKRFFWQHLYFLFCEIRGSKQGKYLGYAKKKLLSQPGQFSPKILLPLRCI